MLLVVKSWDLLMRFLFTVGEFGDPFDERDVNTNGF